MPNGYGHSIFSDLLYGGPRFIASRPYNWYGQSGKLLCEVTIVSGVNDKFRVQRVSDASWTVVTITAGRYRDVDHLCRQISADMVSQITWGQWAIHPANDTDDVSTSGYVTITGDEDWELDWTTDSYGQYLRDILGFDGSETVDGSTFDVTGSSYHRGGFYPTYPAFDDDRPEIEGKDRWLCDGLQASTRNGRVATKGGSNLIKTRRLSFLLPQSDLEQYEDFLGRVARGESFVYYHDRADIWPGTTSTNQSSGIYKQYKLISGGEPVRFAPEQLGDNYVFHTATMQLQQYVAATE